MNKFRMFLQLNIILFFVFASTIFCKANPQTDGSGRIVYNFDGNWKFKLGDDVKASAFSFKDDSWRKLNVPHDWSIEGAYNKNNPAGVEGAFLPTGIGWYRKAFNWQPNWQNKNVRIQFDGVYCNSTVWINGIKLGTRPNGYIGFSYDLTPYLKKGLNIIAVKVDHSKAPSGRWYTGSGIYRHVRVIATEKIYVPENGLLISTPEIKNTEAVIKTDLDIDNGTTSDKTISVFYNIIAKNGEVQVRNEKNLTLKKGTNKLNFNLNLKNPLLWSTETPNLYKLKVEVKEGSKTWDVYESNFGVRSISFSADKGFLLNGVKTILKGVGNHQDGGAVGVAVPYDVLYNRLVMLKQMGCNAIRTTHNPFAPEFYDLCDQMGFLVMDEAFDGWEKPKAEYDYGLYFEDWWRKDLGDFIKRDFNHPCVIIWSIGNEIKGYTDETQQKLISFVKAIDTSRPVSQGRSYFTKGVDLAGFNGHGEYKGALEEFHKKNPDKPVIGTEMTHGLQTRNVYRTQTKYRMRDYPAPWEKGEKFSSIQDKVFWQDDLTKNEVFTNINPIYHSSYDNDLIRMSIRDYWRTTKDLTYFLGGFRWTGFDYLGESFAWPARTMNYGVIDLANFPTDSYYLYQSLWTDKPMVHLLPNWTLTGKEGVEIPVIAYTNADTAELFLNGKSLGEKPMTEDYRILWKVPYAPGQLKVIAKKNGKVVATDVQNTASEAYTFSVKKIAKPMLANQADVAQIEISIIDKKGNEVPYANNLINFEVTGPGKLIGVENGDVLDLSSSKGSQRKAFNGKCLALVQSTDKPGEIKIKISAKNLVSKQLIIPVGKTVNSSETSL
ncbi:DUF4982 domain-containing protein [Pedobacter sp. SD-b]|uniref:DUF4982 domain-containing protein n=1 Tax=Pedobacter segetis TaxID=2793069 RepID=A0ABS1BMH8_9SPHI|nr:sugar-binding domain-containing protein [Pedobacter segetis]MBK0384061.1 DUF4982 domain-containing protein [Pedobacter segetis]